MSKTPQENRSSNAGTEADRENISMWVGQCLLNGQDGKIIQAISAADQSESRRVFDALAEHFSDRVFSMGKRKVKACLIAAPIAFLSPIQLDESAFVIENITPLLESFYTHRLLDRKGTGIVLLNRLIDHEALEQTPLSSLYELSASIFECAKSSSDVLVNAGDFGVGSDTSWLPMPDGYYTMRHMLGVVFWDIKASPPPLLEHGNNYPDWQTHVANKLLLNALSPEGYSLQVTSVAPMRLFEATTTATFLMVEKAINALSKEAQEQVATVEADMTIGFDSGTPGRTEIRIAMFDSSRPNHNITTAAFRLSVMESMETGKIMDGVKDILLGQKIQLRKVCYANGPATSAPMGGLH